MIDRLAARGWGLVLQLLRKSIMIEGQRNALFATVSSDKLNLICDNQIDKNIICQE